MYYGDTKKTTKFKLSDDINHKEINFNNVKESLDSMILIGTLENLNTFKDSLFEIVNKNFECNLTDINSEKEENVSDLSKYLYGKLNKSQINQIEELTGKKVTDSEKQIIAHGPDEIDLVHSGLEETMINATREIMEIWKANPSIPDMRTAAYVCAINKVATSYAELGIFP